MIVILIRIVDYLQKPKPILTKNEKVNEEVNKKPDLLQSFLSALKSNLTIQINVEKDKKLMQLFLAKSITVQDNPEQKFTIYQIDNMKIKVYEVKKDLFIANQLPN